MRLALAIAILLATDAAGAEPLTWSAPPACPVQSAVRGEIERLLGRPLDGEVRADIRATRRRGGGWQVQLRTEIGDARGERTLAGATCEEVAHAAALVIAMAIDPAAVASAGDRVPIEPEPEPQPEPQPVAQIADTEPLPGDLSDTGEPAVEPGLEVEVDSALPSDGDAVRAVALDLGFAIRALSVGSLGPLPGNKSGVGGAAAVTAGPWRVELGGAYFFQRRETLDADPSRGADFRMWSVEARACRELPLANLWACAAGQLGRIHGDAFGVRMSRVGSSTWLGVGGGIIGRIGLTGTWGLSSTIDVLAGVRRPRFHFETPESPTIHEAAAVAAMVSVGVEAAWP